MPKIDTRKKVMIRAIVDRAVPETVEYKPYRTELTFAGRVMIEVPVPAEMVTTDKGGVQVLTLEGWKEFLKEYTRMTQELAVEYRNQFRP